MPRRKAGGRVAVYIEGDESVGKAAGKSVVAIEGVKKATDDLSASQTKGSSALVQYRTQQKQTGDETKSLDDKLRSLNTRFAAMDNIVGTLKFPTLIAGAGYAAQGIGVLGAGAVATTSALAPLSGALAAYPAILGAVGQASGVLALTQLPQLQEALGGSEEALKSLSPAARDFLGVIKSLEPEFKKMRSQVQGKVFAGLTSGLDKAKGNFGAIEKVMVRTGAVMGDLADRAGTLVGSKGFGRDFEKVGKGNAAILERLGISGLHFGDALRHVMVAAQPLLMWMSKGAVTFSEWVDGQAKAGRESGKLAGFFGKTRDVMEHLVSITGSLAGGFFEIGKAAAPLGRTILASLDESAQTFENWTNSMRGQNALRDYFQQAKPAIFEIGRLVKDVGAAFLGLSNQTGFYELTHQIRTELVPVLASLVEETTQAFGPHIIAALVQVGKLMGTMAGSSGPLVAMVDAFGSFASVINTLLGEVPGLKTVAVTIGGIIAVNKATKILGMVTGFSSLVKVFKDLRVAAFGAAAATEAATVAGATATRTSASGGIAGAAANYLGARGGVLGTTAKTTVAGGAGEFGEKAALREAGLIGGAGGIGGALAKFGLKPGIGGFVLPVTLSIGSVVATHEVSQKLGQKTGTSGSGIPGYAATAFSTIAGIGSPALGAYTGINELTGGGLPGPGSVTRKLGKVSFSQELKDRFLARDQFKKVMADIDVDAVTGLGKLKADLATGLQIAGGVWKTGTRPWRQHTAAAMEATVAAIRTGMKDGTVNAKRGQKEINDLLERIHLVKGDDPIGLARDTAKSFKKTGGITAAGVRDYISKLAAMPKGAREKAEEATDKMLRAWANGNPKIEHQIDSLTAYQIRKFGATNKQLREGVEKGATGPVADAYRELAEGVGGALKNIGTNTSEMLQVLGFKTIGEFEITQIGNGKKFTTPKEAKAALPTKHGGPTRAKGGIVKERQLYEVGEEAPQHHEWVIATNPAYKQDNVRYWMQAGHDLGIPGFKEGGLPHPQITGGLAGLAGLGNKAIDKVWGVADKGISAAQARKRKQRESAAGNLSVATGPIQKMAKALVTRVFGAQAWDPFVSLEMSEAGWDPHAQNPTSTAYGLAQNLYPQTYPAAGRPGSKAPILLQAKAQLQWMVKYIKDRYGSPAAAWNYHLANNWYKAGGLVGKKSGRESLANTSSTGPADAKHVIAWAQHHLGDQSKWGYPGEWCGAFLGADMQAHGIEPPSGYPLASAWGSWGSPGDAGAGNVVVIGGSGHVGLSLGGGKMISGNFSDEVAVSTIAEAAGGRPITGYRKPPYTSESKTGTPGSKGSSPSLPPEMGLSKGTAVTKLPGMKPTPVKGAALGLPAPIQALLAQPGVGYSQKLAIGNYASQIAERTKQTLIGPDGKPVLDSEGNPVDSMADDKAAAKYVLGLQNAKRKRIQKKLREVEKELSGRQTEKQRRKSLARADALRGELASVSGEIATARETLHARPEGGEDTSAAEEAEAKRQEEEAKRQEEIRMRLEEMLALQKQANEEKQRALNLSQSQYGVLAQAITAVVSGQIGGQVGLGFQTPSVAGSLASY